MSLPETLSNLRRIDGGFATIVPDGWMQGRTSYGGFSAALALEAHICATPYLLLKALREGRIVFPGNDLAEGGGTTPTVASTPSLSTAAT